MSPESLLYAMALQHASSVGDVTAKKLISHCGSPEEVFKEKASNLLKIDGIGSTLVAQLNLPDNLRAAEAELKYMERAGVRGLYFQDPAYPQYLKHCIDGPIVLFAKGNSTLNPRRPISIVGTRSLSAHGFAFCRTLVEGLALSKATIISGLAYGADIVAHKTALENGMETIACLGHGLDRIYPPDHTQIANELQDNGALLTEYWSKTASMNKSFVRRNRIIAGLSQATVVIESGAKGGSLITAEMALQYNRDVFAVPGRPTDRNSLGTNRLIMSQKAQMICSAEDLIYWLGWEPEEALKPVQKALFIDLSEQEKLLYDCLKESDKEHLDQLALKCKMTTHQTASLLLELELKGAIRPLPGKLFEAI
jgi:DNA processing protein